MMILKINPNKPEKELVKLAVGILKRNGIVVYPTDTLYGIAANALNKEAILKVYRIKGRNFRKPLSIAFHSLSQARRYVKFNQLALKLAKRFLPGPLTIILQMKYKFPKELTGSKNIGIRIPDNKIALDLIKEFGYPITATSANISNGKDPVTADGAIAQIGDKVDLILDGGRCRLNKPSTAVEILNNKIKILRVGVIKRKQLQSSVPIGI